MRAKGADPPASLGMCKDTEATLVARVLSSSIL